MESNHATMPSLPDQAAVREALRRVDDPEAGMNIVDLGLVYKIEVGERAVCVEMTMTSLACPIGDLLTQQARTAIAAIVPPGTEVTARLVWDPVWTPSMMSNAARHHFGWT